MNWSCLCQNSGKLFMKNYLLLYLGIFIYSFCSIMNKIASGYEFLSWYFCLFYGCGLLFLMLYAVLWQQILKSFPLTTAYANRSFVMILTMIWGLLLFKEHISLNMLIGAVIIMFGINLVVKADE